jgi:hypothetical protein
MRTLRIGSEGHDVRTLENFLTGRNIDVGEVDGRFTKETSFGVIDFQKDARLGIDGVVGRQTWAALLAAGIDLVLDADQEWPPPPDNLTPLTSNEHRMRRWGRFEYRHAPEPGNREAIEILGDWEEKHIVRIHCPVFGHAVRLHKEVAEDYLAFMQDVIAAELQGRLRTYDGGFVPRFIRGSTQTLSNHAWGTAFDVNYQWNQLGATPAYKGEVGSVRELVPLANKHNWYWGGHFKKKHRRDGMHFEHV